MIQVRELKDELIELRKSDSLDSVARRMEILRMLQEMGADMSIKSDKEEILDFSGFNTEIKILNKDELLKQKGGKNKMETKTELEMELRELQRQAAKAGITRDEIGMVPLGALILEGSGKNMALYADYSRLPKDGKFKRLVR